MSLCVEKHGAYRSDRCGGVELRHDHEEVLQEPRASYIVDTYSTNRDSLLRS